MQAGHHSSSPVVHCCVGCILDAMADVSAYGLSQSFLSGTEFGDVVCQGHQFPAMSQKKGRRSGQEAKTMVEAIKCASALHKVSKGADARDLPTQPHALLPKLPSPGVKVGRFAMPLDRGKGNAEC